VERLTMSNQPDLVPILWNAPHEAYHLKPCNAQHYLKRVNLTAFYELPKHQQKKHIFVCKKCGGEVVWADSKSGSKFLANVKHHSFRYGRRGRYHGTDYIYDPRDWHSKTCTPTADGSVHPNALAYEERNERLLKEQAEREGNTSAPETPDAEYYEWLNEELREKAGMA
jgi:hypothetical protein